ncbi:hypothetical protein JX265_009036 [Neoarthrinium moseri]|uniref:SMODS and SLOG-associating 2TM effector domain-containing protein n=1 Tax=Neoarthrinium moseri TaxID=1658444 RepID=A0A9P9WH63_9PEZI|nr:uncharacterized protein JN550_007906 [Neoarthrinium moseri]KAI1846661.1 hypothetical protein JX266_007234 [Neoarthrinium moseri]KAI1862990.1 hypothetical protein JX265_009036 [Neoarthrinium moseri]KAI1866217.1 hypothetical protein JN550_007906 [Neoarthrinium moseri]
MSTAPKDVNSPLLSPSTRTAHPQVSFSAKQADSKSTPSTNGPRLGTDINSRPMAPTNATPIDPVPLKADTNMSWGAPLGLKVRGANDENLIIFRKAVGINWHPKNVDNATLEEGRKSATGIYKSVLDAEQKKNIQHDTVTVLLYFLYFAQVVVGAALTALGPNASQYVVPITLLGAVNTVIAGVLALIKGSGQPQRLGKDQVGYRKVQDWIEETEALLAVGVIGRDRREVGLLVEVAFKKYNAAKASEENNRPDMYVHQPMESLGNRTSSDSFERGSKSKNTTAETEEAN